jgi:Esterase-like activity of phytase
MKAKVLPLLLVLGLLLSVCSFAFFGLSSVQAANASIAGTIFLDGKPAAGFRVRLDPTGADVTTKDDGRYKFDGLKAGFYVVRVVDYDKAKVQAINGRDYSNQTTTDISVERAIDLYFNYVVPPKDEIIARYVLPDTRLGDVQNSKLPGSIINDRKFLLGGIGSDMWRNAVDPANEFWLVTDRGPNGQIRVDGANRRTFPVPEFTPLILKVKAEGGSINILEVLPILGQSGKPVTGISNIRGYDETPYNYNAQDPLPFNPNGLDSEGIIRTKAGEFWLCDEYSPSIIKVDSTGKVVKRYVPESVELTGTDYPVARVFPSIYNKRRGNRGFEGIAISPDEKTLFITLQSPLQNPTAPIGNASRSTRIVAFDIATEKVIGEYVYRFDPIKEFDPTPNLNPDEMKLSGIIALTNTKLLILERTDFVAKLYLVDTTTATNLLGTKWNDPATSPTLEALPDPLSEGVSVLPKELIINLDSLPDMPDKVEGVAVISRNTIAVINDNDFDIGDIDAEGNNVGKNVKNQVLYINLAKSLPLN